MIFQHSFGKLKKLSGNFNTFVANIYIPIMNTTTNNVSILPSERIVSLDLLRGIAVLGILVMNIQSFAMISSAYVNPLSYGNFTGINKITWVFSQLIASEKFINIFSLLFGAGVILLYERKKTQGANVWLVQIKRNFWLFWFGIVHAYLIWYGDILVAYSMCGVFVFLFRNTSPKKLLIMAAIFFILPTLLSIRSSINVANWSELDIFYALKSWLPNHAQVQEELAAVKGGYIDLLKARFPHLKYIHTYQFVKFYFWRISALMFTGMAFYKNGIVTAQKSRLFYKKMIFIGLPLGTAFSVYGIWQNFAHQWNLEYSLVLGYLYNYFGSIATSIGFIGIVMLIAKSDKFIKFKRAMTSTGKMAFTNYILMSVICGLIFNGFGLGLFGSLERFEQLLVVFGIWTILITLSVWWLKRFFYGPLEWLWRYLTYGKRPPFKRAES
jgi:uncharacterized protein